jgi:hypothetical protein
MADTSRRSQIWAFLGAFVLALIAAFAITTSLRTSSTVERSAAQHGSQATSGSATNQPEPTRTDTVR